MTVLVLTLAGHVADAVEALAARDGATASSWLSAQVEHAFASDGSGPIPARPKRPSRSSRRRYAARSRAARAAAKASKTDGDTHGASLASADAKLG